MADEDTRSLIELYEGRFREQGACISTLGWRSSEDQNLRFKLLSEVGQLRGCSVCDVGCGFGDLLGYLVEVDQAVKYTGIDIVPSFLMQARTAHPCAQFLCIDLAIDEYTEEHDYFVSSGALSFKRKDNMAHAEQMIKKMFSLSRIGVAINFLSTYVNYRHPRNFHYSPEYIFRIARGLSQWVTIRHDYPLWEFTLYMYKKPRG